MLFYFARNHSLLLPSLLCCLPNNYESVTCKSFYGQLQIMLFFVAQFEVGPFPALPNILFRSQQLAG